MIKRAGLLNGVERSEITVVPSRFEELTERVPIS